MRIIYTYLCLVYPPVLLSISSLYASNSSYLLNPLLYLSIACLSRFIHLHRFLPLFYPPLIYFYTLSILSYFFNLMVIIITNLSFSISSFLFISTSRQSSSIFFYPFVEYISIPNSFLRILRMLVKKSIENIISEILIHASGKKLQMFEDKTLHK